MKRIWILLLALGIALSLHSQDVSDDSRVYVGGNLGLGFGTYTNVYVAPEVYYCIMPRLHVGMGLSYAYTRDNIAYTSSSVLGAKLAARFIVVDQLYAQVEYEGVKYSNTYYSNLTSSVFDESRLLIGAGFRQWIGMRSFTYINVFWNPDATGFTYFSGINPVIKVGLNFGF